MIPGRERWLRRMSCAYRALLLFYPQTFQREHGREMALLFRDSARDVLTNGAGFDVVRFVLHIGHDWARSLFREGVDMTRAVLALRWIATLPLAILTAAAAQQIIGMLITRFSPRSILATVFLMAVIFVTVGIAVAPSRRDSVARIAIGVVMGAAAISAGLGALNMNPGPALFGACMLAGGIAAYLPWRVRLRSRSA